jgi:hypothetical protein
MSTSLDPILVRRICYSTSILVHAILSIFFPLHRDDCALLLDRFLDQLKHPTMDDALLKFFFTRLTTASCNLLQVVRLLSTRDDFSRSLLESSHAFSTMKTRFFHFYILSFLSLFL